MAEPIRVPLTPAQVVEFVGLARQVSDAQIASNHAARAIVLGVYPLASFDGQRLNVNVDAACIVFTPNVMPEAAG